MAKRKKRVKQPGRFRRWAGDRSLHKKGPKANPLQIREFHGNARVSLNQEYLDVLFPGKFGDSPQRKAAVDLAQKLITKQDLMLHQIMYRFADRQLLFFFNSALTRCYFVRISETKFERSDIYSSKQLAMMMLKHMPERIVWKEAAELAKQT